MEVAHHAILSKPAKVQNNCSQLLKGVKVIPHGSGSKSHNIHPEFHTMG
jgi:hypothetical protein